MSKAKTREDGLIERKRTIDGKVMHFYGRTVSEVERKIDDYKAERKRLAEAGEPFEDIAAAWWEEYQHKVKYGTIRAYASNYKRVRDEFAGYRMKEITPGMVNNWALSMQSQNYTHGTARNAMSVLSLIYKFWRVNYKDVYNPIAGVTLPRGMPKTRRLPPSSEQLAIVKAHPEGFGLCAWLFAYTGCRLGEVVALQWRDVDFEAGLIHITKSTTWVNNQPYTTTTKTENGVRDVPILAPLLPLLQERKGRPDDYVVSGEKQLTDRAYHHQ